MPGKRATKAKKNLLVQPQKPPKKNKEVPLWEKVIHDMKSRDNMGYQKYKTRLQPFNGRNASVDAYQEVLDLAVYFKQMIEERKAMIAVLKHYARSVNIYTPDNVDAGYEAFNLLRKLGEIGE